MQVVSYRSFNVRPALKESIKCSRKRSVLNKLVINRVVNKVEYNRINIFYKEKETRSSFDQFTREYKVISFPKLKLYAESPKVMVNKNLL